MAGGDEHFELGEHTGGKLVDLFLEWQIHLICPAQKIIFVKMIEERGEDGHDVCDREMAVEAGVGEHDADVLTVCGIFPAEKA